jgi:EmrB/QacA subfamily drug resistance transporter
MVPALRRNIVPLIVATGLFMENLDATVLATSLPAIARDLGVNPIHLKLALTTYLLALAVFIPASGWMADRFGAKRVFRAAILVFAAGSIACALSTSLGSLVGARVLQGIGGAMMAPVGRLIVWRAVPKTEVIGAVAWLTIPALIGPVMGPPLGGFITTYFNWRWIFWINVPVALVGILLVSRFIPHLREAKIRDFDLTGFLLIGPGLSLFLTGLTLMGIDIVDQQMVWVIAVLGAVLIAAYVWHALRTPTPLIELRLLNIPTFRAAVVGGFLFRMGIGAGPFLLPLLFQSGFGLTAFQSGMLTFATGVGAIVMKTQAATILRLYGYRRVLIVNAVIAAFFTALPSVFTAETPMLLIVALFLVGGLSRSLQFTSVNTLAYADMPDDKLSRATSFSAVLQELSRAAGVTVAAFALELMFRIDGGGQLDVSHFPPVFLLIAALALGSAAFFWVLPKDSGVALLGSSAPATQEALTRTSRKERTPS